MRTQAHTHPGVYATTGSEKRSKLNFKSSPSARLRTELAISLLIHSAMSIMLICNRAVGGGLGSAATQPQVSHDHARIC